MSTNRSLLNLFGRDTLVRLMRDRGLAPARENDERRKALAHSYHGDVEALILDLSRQELVELLESCTFDVRGVESRVSNPGKYRHAELQAFALRAFAGRRVRIPAEFVPVEEQHRADGANDAFEEDDDGDEPTVAQALGIESSAWSRPRQIDRILDALGHDPVQRLRTRRFQDLIGELLAGGVEACLADDALETVCTPADDSPGIETKLRLRLVDHDGGPRPARGRKRRDATPALDEEDGARSDVNPQIVVRPGEKPIPIQAARPPAYELALLRLRFLTAVPSPDRRTQAAWPEAYLSAATRGLSVLPQELALLRVHAVGLCVGNHSPYESIPRLSQVLLPAEWDDLLGDLQALNPSEHEFVRAIVEQVAPIPVPRSAPGAWRGASSLPPENDLPPDTERVPPIDESMIDGKARSSTRPSPPAEAEPELTNHRDLGVLAGMFDEG